MGKEIKTKKSKDKVIDFLNAIENEQRKKDSISIFKLLNDFSKEPPKMWGTSIVGFGEYQYKYESGREGDFFKMGFPPRKTALTIYIMAGFDRYSELMDKLGKVKTGKSCLYL